MVSNEDIFKILENIEEKINPENLLKKQQWCDSYNNEKRQIADVLEKSVSELFSSQLTVV